MGEISLDRISHKIVNYLLITKVISILEAFVEPPLVIHSIAPSSSTLLAAVGSAVAILPADPEAVWLIAPPVTATPPISKEIAAVPVVVALLCVIILIILPPSGTHTNVDDAVDTSDLMSLHEHIELLD